VPRSDWDAASGDLPDDEADWHPRFGDRSQEIVFIGQDLEPDLLRARLEACLLDERLLAQESETWSAMTNPFSEELCLGAHEHEPEEARVERPI
jgi:hypothetical protein